MSKNLIFTGKKDGLTLAQKMREGLATIKKEKDHIKHVAKIVLLLDVSGSMSEHVGEKRKIDHLREAVQNYTALRKVSFSGDIYENSIPDPKTNTDLAYAFEYLLSSNPLEIILISDGLPDSEIDAINTAKLLNCPVNIIYVGPGSDKGETFMKRLAFETQGKQVTVDTTKELLSVSNVLTDNIRLMLPGN